jgi:xanthosine utilization system XapX-like protein
VSGKRVALWLVLCVVIGALVAFVFAVMDIDLPTAAVVGALVGVMSVLVLRASRRGS